MSGKIIIELLARLCTVCSVLVALNSVVRAEDRPTRWTGLYFGAGLVNSATDVQNTKQSCTPSDDCAQADQQALLDGERQGGAAVFAGYQLALSHWIIGAEGAFSSFRSSDSGFAENVVPGLGALGGGTTWNRTMENVAGARLRLGRVVSDDFAVYATAGLAATQLHLSGRNQMSPLNSNLCGPCIEASASRTAIGLQIGIGAEWMLGDNWILRGDYELSHFGSQKLSGSASGLTAHFEFAPIDVTQTRLALAYRF